MELFFICLFIKVLSPLFFALNTILSEPPKWSKILLKYKIANQPYLKVVKHHIFQPKALTIETKKHIILMYL